MTTPLPLWYDSDEILNLPSDYSDLEYDVVLISDTDIYAGNDAHGTVKLFRFLRSVGVDCCLLTTGERHLDLEHSYYVGHLSPSHMVCPSKRQADPHSPINQRFMWLASLIFDQEMFEKSATPKKEKLVFETSIALQDPSTKKFSNLFVRLYEDDINLYMSDKMSPGERQDNLNLFMASLQKENKHLVALFWKYMILGTRRLPKFKKIIFCSREEAYASDPMTFFLLQNIRDNPICYYYGMVHDTYAAFCAYPKKYDCEKFKSELGCYNCESVTEHNMLTPKEERISPHYSKMRFDQMEQIFSLYGEQIHYVGASNFSLKQAKSSYLLRNIKQSKCLLQMENSPTILFEKLEKENFKYRQAVLGALEQQFDVIFSENTFIFCWSAMDFSEKRKGFQKFADSVWRVYHQLTQQDKIKIEDVIFFLVGGYEDCETLLPVFPGNVRTFILGKQAPPHAISIIGASDVYCCTTLEDAGPRTVSESLGIGTPVISFDNCIAPDLIDEKSGWIVKSGDVEGYVDAMIKAIKLKHSTPEKLKEMSRMSCESYSKNYNIENLKKQWYNCLELENK